MSEINGREPLLGGDRSLLSEDDERIEVVNVSLDGLDTRHVLNAALALLLERAGGEFIISGLAMRDMDAAVWTLSVGLHHPSGGVRVRLYRPLPPNRVTF